MTLKNPRWFLAGGLACALLFAALQLMRLGFISLGEGPRPADRWPSPVSLEGQERWMMILQDGQRIGTSHTRLEPLAAGYRLKETVRMRLNTMGLVQDLVLASSGWLNPDLTLDRFTFTLQSGRFAFGVRGRVESGHLVCQVRTGDEERPLRLALDGPLYLTAGILPALIRADPVPGEQQVFAVFDPATLARVPLTATLLGRETITLGQDTVQAWKVLLVFKGITQEAWLDDTGQVLREKGLLGIRQERVSRTEALAGEAVTGGGDLTRVAAVVPDRVLPEPGGLTRLTLQLAGVDVARYRLDGGRQRLAHDRLTVTRETLSDLPERLSRRDLPPAAAASLASSPFVQSDHPAIRSLAARLADPTAPPIDNLRRLIDWMQANIVRRPVLSVPNALGTLQHRMGDCNEHAVLLAALARAAGYPAQVETGLVYLEGRFYYHAWNRVYLGRWITVDALFGQLPADVSHIRFARGSAGEQLDLLPLIGNLKIRVLGTEP